LSDLEEELRRMVQPPITIEDLDRIYVVIPNDQGTGTINITVRQMSDRQFRWWIKAKADHHGVPMLVPMGRIGYETRVRMLNRLVRAGVRIYMVPLGTPPPEEM
jgi:hypothetical protein